MKHTNAPPWSFFTSFAAPTLAARRRRARLFRGATAMFLCLAVFGVLYSLDAITGTDTIVTAATPIARGTTIRHDDVVMMTVPASPVTGKALHTTDKAVGSIAQHPIEAGQPLYAGSVGKTRTITTGDTVLDIAVANSINALIPGDTVSLVSAVGCEPTSQEHDNEQPAACTLASQAMIMETKARQGGNSTEQNLLTVVLDPQSAIRVMKAGESGAIIAVHR